MEVCAVLELGKLYRSTPVKARHHLPGNSRGTLLSIDITFLLRLKQPQCEQEEFNVPFNNITDRFSRIFQAINCTVTIMRRKHTYKTNLTINSTAAVSSAMVHFHSILTTFGLKINVFICAVAGFKPCTIHSFRV